MKHTKPLPLFMTLLSLGYFIYVVSNGSSRMIGDEIGGDPGGMMLPLLLSIFMFIGFGTLTLKERPDDSRQKISPLFPATFAAALLYVVLQKSVGFIICSTLLIYTLTLLYLENDSARKIKPALITLTGTLAWTIAVYTVFRTVTRTLLRLGRKKAIPAILGNSNVTAILSLVIVTLFLLLIVFTIYRKAKDTGWRNCVFAGLMAYGSTLYLFIIFKQFFLVSLARGIIRW